MNILSSLILSSLLIFSPALLAENLTDKQVTQWIKAWPQLQAWGDKHEKELDALQKKHQASTTTGGPENTMADWFNNVSPMLKASGYYKEYSTLLSNNGFSSVEQWADISNRIFAATLNAQMAQQNPNMKAQIEAQMAQLKNANLPPEQQKMMMQMMQQTQAAFKAMDNVPAADKAVVSKHLPALRQLLDMEQR